MIKRCFFKTIFVLCFIFYVTTNKISATDFNNKKVDSVIINVHDKLVAVNLADYRVARKYKNNVYYYLAKDKNYLEVIGIISDDKEIGISEYRTRLKFNNPKRSISYAIEQSEEMDAKIIDRIIPFAEIDYFITNVKIGSIDTEISGNNVEVDIPRYLFNEAINNITIEFQKPVKMVLVNGKSMDGILLDKFIRSGYEVDKYYNKFDFIIGDAFKYSLLVDYPGNLIISVENEYGYRTHLSITINVE